MMKALLTLVLFMSFSEYVDASILDVFKDEEGHTKWQHVANFSGSVLIVLLSMTLVSLLVSRFKLNRRNRELREIKTNLEQTVQKRTENLNKSNRLLQQSNALLEEEIAERKATAALLLSSETYLKSILASMPSMLIGLNEKLEVTHWNRTAESITGRSEDDVRGRYLWDVYSAITISADQVEKVLQSNQLEVIKHSQRGQYYFDITIYPLDGSEPGVVVVIENVTQRSLAENMLIQRDKMASMGELASTMAHDINTPLQGILADVQLVKESLETIDLSPSGAAELLQDAIERGHQASAVVNNLLEFSSSQGGEKQTVMITQVIDHCIELGHNVLAEPEGLRFRDVVIEKRYADAIPTLRGYVAELQQVFLSLFRHACHALGGRRGDGDGSVPKLTIYVEESYGNLLVNIHHNGEGLTEDQQQELFEPFVQHTNPASPKPIVPENRLSFSYFVVTEHHDGEMAVTSGSATGTTFHLQFHLPSGT